MCTGADGKPVGIDAFAGDFALIAFGRAKDHELSASKLMRLRDVIAQSGAPARMPTPWRAWVCSRVRARKNVMCLPGCHEGLGHTDRKMPSA